MDIAYFDHAKAFDKVLHRLLLIKLRAYGIDGKLLAWLSAWLEGRRQRVVVGNAKSPWLPVISGTTQGTVLGFLLFLIYSNDLPAQCAPQEESKFMLLADDTKTFQSVGGDMEQQTRQKALKDPVDSIARWADTWKMEMNPNKSGPPVLHQWFRNCGGVYREGHWILDPG